MDKVYGEDWIALGDAAFTPDPLSGKGIEFAIELRYLEHSRYLRKHNTLISRITRVGYSSTKVNMSTHEISTCLKQIPIR